MKSLFSLILALLLLFAPASRAESDLRAENAALRAEVERLTARLELYADPTVIAVFDGGCVTYDDIREDYEMFVSFYSLFDIDISQSPDDLMALQLTLIDDCIERKLLDAYVERENIVLLSPEAEDAVLAEADAAYESALNEMLAYFDAEEALDAQAQAEQTLEEIGSSRQEIRAAYLDEARQAAAVALITADITVSEDEIRACYEEKLSEDQEYYTSFPGEFAWADEFGFSLWVPEGFRLARAVRIPFSEAQQAAYDEILIKSYETDDAAARSDLARQMDAIYEQLLPEAEAVYARLQAGESFETLRAEFAEDSALLGSLAAPEGFLVSASSWEQFSTDEILALSSPGEVTGPLRCDSGYILCEYFAPVASGPVSYAEAYDAVKELALSTKRAQAYEDAVRQWREDARIEYLLNRLNG